MAIDMVPMEAAKTIVPEGAPQATAPKPLPAWAPCLLMACLSGGLLWACYFPLAWGWCLGWVALMPLLTLVRAQARPREIYCCAFLGGVSFFAPVLLWMGVADPRMYFLWALLWTYCALYFPVAIALIRWLDRRWWLPLVITVPVCWIALEYLRSWLFTGFGWYLLGHTMQAALPTIQVADLGGVFVVSFFVAAVNALLFDLLYQVPAVRAALRQVEPGPLDHLASIEFFNNDFFAQFSFRRNLILEGLGVLLLVVAQHAYGYYRLGQNHFEPGPTVALLQGNLDQRIRNDAGRPEDDDDTHARPTARQTIAHHYAALCRRALEFPQPDLMIWPETSYPHDWIEVSPQLPSEEVPLEWRNAEVEVRQHFSHMAKTCPTQHLVGIISQVLGPDGHPRRHNSALQVTAEGRIADRVDKMHRLPFGEYLPLREWLPFMEWFSPYPYEYSIRAGTRFTRFALGAYRFGVLICYEDTDPYLARHYAISEPDGPPVDFLVNLSNDGWFNGSSEHDEHLAVSRFRAIECRRALARAANMGISAVIDGNGQVLQPRPVATRGEPALWSVGDALGHWSEMPAAAWAGFKKTDFVLKAVIPIDRRSSIYAKYGDWLPCGCLLFVATAIGAACIRRRGLVAPAGG